MNDTSRLSVLIDGVPMPAEQARALWLRFSEHMDAHKGDMDGFAKLNGYISVRPQAQGGQAVLVIKSKAAPASAPSKPALKPAPKQAPKPAKKKSR